MRSTLISRLAGDPEAAPFHRLFSDRDCRRDVRLAVRARLGHVRAGALSDPWALAPRPQLVYSNPVDLFRTKGTSVALPVERNHP